MNRIGEISVFIQSNGINTEQKELFLRAMKIKELNLDGIDIKVPSDYELCGMNKKKLGRIMGGMD